MGPPSAVLDFAPVWSRWYVPLLAVSGANLALDIYGLFRRTRTAHRLTLKLSVLACQLGVALMILSARVWVVAAPGAPVGHGVLADKLPELLTWVNTGVCDRVRCSRCRHHPDRDGQAVLQAEDDWAPRGSASRVKRSTVRGAHQPCRPGRGSPNRRATGSHPLGGALPERGPGSSPSRPSTRCGSTGWTAAGVVVCPPSDAHKC